MKSVEINGALTQLTTDSFAPKVMSRGRKGVFMDNSELLTKVLILLRNNRVGKKTIRDFEQFRRDFEDTRKSFHLTFPEPSGNLDVDETIRNA